MHANAYLRICINMHQDASCVFMQKYPHACLQHVLMLHGENFRHCRPKSKSLSPTGLSTSTPFWNTGATVQPSQWGSPITILVLAFTPLLDLQNCDLHVFIQHLDGVTQEQLVMGSDILVVPLTRMMNEYKVEYCGRLESSGGDTHNKKGLP